jgi:hypothetical protein
MKKVRIPSRAAIAVAAAVTLVGLACSAGGSSAPRHGAVVSAALVSATAPVKATTEGPPWG